MKFIIETEDKTEIQLMTKAEDFRTFIIDLMENLRHKIKYEEHSEEYYSVVEDLRSWISDEMEDRGLQYFINLDN